MRVPTRPRIGRPSAGQKGNGLRAGSAYPMVRVLALVAARSHVPSAIRFGAYAIGEVTLARDLWSDLPHDSLTLIDRNCLVAADLRRPCKDGANRHFITRAKSSPRLRVIKRLGKGDALVEIELSTQTRRSNPGLPERWTARAITCQREGFPKSVLLTSLVESVQYPRNELIALYPER